jgi:hypothetical protein
MESMIGDDYGQFNADRRSPAGLRQLILCKEETKSALLGGKVR